MQRDTDDREICEKGRKSHLCFQACEVCLQPTSKFQNQFSEGFLVTTCVTPVSYAVGCKDRL